MKIINEIKEPEKTTLDNIFRGDIFMVEGSSCFYLRTGEIDDDFIPCFNLTTNNQDSFDSETQVIPVESDIRAFN